MKHPQQKAGYGGLQNQPTAIPRRSQAAQTNQALARPFLPENGGQTVGDPGGPGPQLGVCTTISARTNSQGIVQDAAVHETEGRLLSPTTTAHQWTTSE
jgi:hypothetical protein